MKQSDQGSVWKRFWPYIVFSLVIVVIIVVVIVVVVTKNKKGDEKAEKEKPSPGSGELTEKRLIEVEEGDVVVDIPVESHPLLSEIYDLFVEEVRGSKLALQDASKRMAQPNQKKMAAEAKRPLANKEFYTKVEDFLSANYERPFEKEGMGGNEDWIDRFGKYVRRNPMSPRFQRMSQLVNMLCGHSRNDDAGSLGGYFWYPKGGCREWHTNKNDALMYRGYFIFVEEEGKSGLNCMIGGPNGKMLEAPDRNGILRLFKVTGEPNPLWHSVWSDTNRFSLGFRLSDRCAEGLKKLI